MHFGVVRPSVPLQLSEFDVALLCVACALAPRDVVQVEPRTFDRVAGESVSISLPLWPQFVCVAFAVALPALLRQSCSAGAFLSLFVARGPRSAPRR